MAALLKADRIAVLVVGLLLVAGSFVLLSENAAIFFLLVYTILAPLLLTGVRRFGAERI